MSVLSEILEWSKNRPKWQQDALRRIVLGIDIDDAQIADLTLLCLREVLPGDDPTTFDILTDTHIAGLTTTTETVIIRSVENLKNVNALASDQRLPFAEKGITVVYGDNGSGKSGYGRVLKHVCRCRSRKPPIHANVYEPAPSSPSSATVDYSVDGNPQKHAWVAGVAPPGHLGQVSFFDSECAGQYVETKSNIAYRPFGLDILPKLVAVCDQVRASLQLKINDLAVRKSFPGFTTTTSAGKLIDTLYDDVSKGDLDRICAKYSDSADRIVALKDLLSAVDTKSVSTRATDLRLKAKRLRTLGDKLDELMKALADDRFSTLREAKLDHQVKKAAAEASDGFEPQKLRGIGTQSWLVLWNAAKQYSNQAAYPGKDFPVTDADALCVLCQQPLQPEGAERLDKLEKYVQHEVQKAAEAATKLFASCSDGFETLAVPNLDSLDEISEIRELDETAEGEVRQFILNATERLKTAKRNAIQAEWNDPPSAHASPGDRLRGFAAKLDEDAEQVERTLQPEVEARLRSELAELTEHELLLSLKDDIAEEIRRCGLRKLYEILYGSANTNTITSKNGEMIRRVLTDDLKVKFEDELKALSLGHLSVDVVDQGNQKGELYYQVELREKKNQTAKAVDILSEGEHKCIALAAFLAEVSTQSNASTIVFDDPVTSLDHGRRETVARRLVQEAAIRPVVVMTHDIVFLLNLNEAADATRTPFATSFLETRGKVRGIPVEGLPWRGLPVQKRVKWLRNELVDLEKTFKNKPTEEYERQASFLWGRLRETWEAGVEEVLLNGAVVRFGRVVSTQRLKHVHDITPEDIAAVDKGMTDSSSWLPGHTQAHEINAPMPEPGVLKQAVEDLDAWRSAIANRR